MTEEIVEIEEKISDYDGISPASIECRVCHLDVDKLYASQNDLCVACRNLSTVYKLNRLMSKLMTPAMILMIFFLLTEDLRPYWYYPLLVSVLPIVIIGYFQMKLHYFRIPQEKRIMSYLKMYDFLTNDNYYYKALETWKLYYSSLNETLRQKIIVELVDSVLRKNKYNPANLFVDWAEPIDKSPGKLVEIMFEFSEIEEGFSIFEGIGLLADVWEYIENDELKNEVLEILEDQVQYLEEVSQKEKKLFLEDLYLLEDDIKEFVGSDEKFQSIIDAIDNFVPDEPPKNFIQQAQMLAQENSRA